MNVPEHYSPVMPYFIVPDANGFINFITEIFDAKEILRVSNEGGSAVLHGEFSINGGTIMFGQGSDVWKPSPTGVFVVTDRVDNLYEKALAKEAEGNQEPGDYGYGRAAGFIDPWGNQWWLNMPDDGEGCNE